MIFSDQGDFFKLWVGVLGLDPHFSKDQGSLFSWFWWCFFINRTFYLFYGHFYQSRLSSLLSVISPTFWLFQDFNNFSHFRRVPIFTFSTTLFNQISNPLLTKINPKINPSLLQKIKIVLTFKQDQAFLSIKEKPHHLHTHTHTPFLYSLTNSVTKLIYIP